MASARGHLLPFLINRAIKAMLCFAFVWGTVTCGQAALAQNALKPAYWKQRLFFVPYQLNKDAASAEKIAKVQLLLSKNGATGWYPLQEATPNVQGFSYHAPADGHYWFSLRHIDRKGQPWPNAVVAPQLHIVIDTTKPTLKLTATLGVAGAITVRYEAHDANLHAESLVLEARTTDGSWTPLQKAAADVAQPDRLLGHANWSTPFGANAIELRASIADHAGHSAQANETVVVNGPSLQMPSKSSPSLSLPSKNLPLAQNLPANSQPQSSTTDPFQANRQAPYQVTSKMPAHDWPANNQVPPQPPAEAPTLAATPPMHNPYTAASGPGESGKTKARLIADGINPASELLGGMTNPEQPTQAGRTPNANNGWTSPTAQSLDVAQPAAGPRTVNSRTFEVEYDLESVGPWGVSKVELWGTHDNGRTWQSYGADPDNRSPIRVSVAGPGTYGFRILVDGANGLRAAPPRTGDQPELVVAVDLQPPSAQLLTAALGQGNQAGHLQLTWQATDTNLEPRPIGLFYSAYPNGPWSTIATGLENTGSYTWRLGRHIPGQFFVRLETRDIAGNTATHQLPSPVTLARPQPTGRLRAVRPVAQPQGF